MHPPLHLLVRAQVLLLLPPVCVEAVDQQEPAFWPVRERESVLGLHVAPLQPAVFFPCLPWPALERTLVACCPLQVEYSDAAGVPVMVAREDC